MRPTKVCRPAAICLAALALLLVDTGSRVQAQSDCRELLNEVSALAQQVNELNDEGDWKERCDEGDLRLLRRMIRVQERLVPLSRRYIECDRSHEAKFTRVFERNLREYRERVARCD
jgi:hypothetical protein